MFLVHIGVAPSVSGPNPISVFLSILRAKRLGTPRPSGSRVMDHSALNPVLAAVAKSGVAGLEPMGQDLGVYIESLTSIDPDDLTPNEALAFWLNLYNAAALDLIRRARTEGHDSVLEVGKGFSGSAVRIADEDLSLEGIEHGKIRRFRDPRIHAALVCGSVSCPTLRYEAFSGESLDQQLDDQMRYFLGSGGFVGDRGARVAHLSRVFLWYGADFVRPGRMPTLLPATKRRIARAASEWLSKEDLEWLETSQPASGSRSMTGDWGARSAVRRESGRKNPPTPSLEDSLRYFPLKGGRIQTEKSLPSAIRSFCLRLVTGDW